MRNGKRRLPDTPCPVCGVSGWSIQNTLYTDAQRHELEAAHWAHVEAEPPPGQAVGERPGDNPWMERLALRAKSAAAFIEGAPSSVEYLLRPYLPRGALVFVTGPPKSGKTSLVTAWVAGLVAQGHRAVAAVEENPPAVMRQRLEPFLQPDPAAFAGLTIIHRAGIALDDAQCAVALLELVRSTGADLLVLDPLAKLHGRDENRASDMRDVLNALSAIAAETGATVVVIHHDRKTDPKGEEETSLQNMRGSVALSGEADVIIRVAAVPKAQRRDRELRFTIEDSGGRYEPFEPKLGVIRFASGVASLELLDPEVVEDDRKAQADAAVKAAILSALPPDQSGAPGLSGRDLVGKVKGKATRAWAVLAEMVDSGEVVRRQGTGRTLLHFRPSASQDDGKQREAPGSTASPQASDVECFPASPPLRREALTEAVDSETSSLLPLSASPSDDHDDGTGRSPGQRPRPPRGATGAPATTSNGKPSESAPAQPKAVGHRSGRGGVQQ